MEYVLVRTANRCKLFRDSIKIPLGDSLKLRNHSPDGFEYGYHGSGPAQTALAILLDLCGEKKALSYYQKFKREVIANLSRKEPIHKIPLKTVREWVEKQPIHISENNKVIFDVNKGKSLTKTAEKWNG